MFVVFLISGCNEKSLANITNAAVLEDLTQSSDNVSKDASTTTIDVSSNSVNNNETRFTNFYKSNGLGRSINAITASFYEPASGTVSIFDEDELYSNYIIEERIGTQEAKISSSTNFDSFATSKASDFAIKVSNESSKGILGLLYMPNSIDFSFNSSFTYDIAKESETNEFYYSLMQIINGNRAEIKGYKDVDYFSTILSDSFLDSARKVDNGTMSPKAFIDLYGTHVMMSAYYGGAIDASYSYIGHKETTNASWFYGLEAGLTYHLTCVDEINSNLYFDYKFTGSSTQENSISVLNIKTRG